MPSPVAPYLGLDSDGRYALCVSPVALNDIGPRVERDTPMPDSVYKFMQSERRDPKLALEALKAAHEYLVLGKAGKTSLVFGQTTKKRK